MPRYHRVEMLGQGATGVVYKAVDSQSDALVALKVPPDEAIPADYPKYQAVYTTEAAILGALSHPAVMALRGQGNDDGTPYIAYEYIRGQALRSLIAAGQVFTPDQTAAFVGELLESIAYLHAERVIHRDVNPNNIILLTEGAAKIKLIDFGSAVRQGQGTPGPLVGTPQYMAPEQLKGGQPDPRSDLFSVGVIAYELLTGQPPFLGNSFPELLQVISAGHYQPATSRNRALPPAIDSFFRTALATEPGQRFQSAPAMRAALQTALGVGSSAPMHLNAGPTLAQIASHQDPAITEIPSVEEGATLSGLEGAYTGEKFPLSGGITTLGGAYADIDLSRDLGIAAQHAWVVYEADRYSLHDADDSGGTRLNRQWVKRAPLLDGDIIEVGASSFRFNDPSQPVGAGRPSGSVEYARPPEEGRTDGEGKKSTGSSSTTTIPRRRSALPVALLTIVLVIGAALAIAAIIVPGQIRTTMANNLDETWIEMDRVLRASSAEDFLRELEIYDPIVNRDVLLAAEPTPPGWLLWMTPVEEAADDAQLMLEMTTTVNDALAAIKAEDNTSGLTKLSTETVGKAVSKLSTFSFKRPPWTRRLAQSAAMFQRLAASFPKPVPVGIDHPINPYVEAFLDGLKAYGDKDFDRAYTLLDEALVSTDKWYQHAPSAEMDQILEIGQAAADDVARTIMAIAEIREAQLELVDRPRPEFAIGDLDKIRGWLRDAGRLMRQVEPAVLRAILEDLGFPEGTDHRTFEEEIDVLEEHIESRKRGLPTTPAAAFN